MMSPCEVAVPGQRSNPLLGPVSVERAAPSRSNPAYRDDGEIVSDMARGDASALADLYDRHAPHMLALARKIVPGAAAEDIVHEAFLEAWEKAASYDPNRGTVRPWLLVRVRSRCLDFLRAAHQSRVSVAGDAFWATLPHPGDDGGLAPDCAAVRRALAGLPEPQREALFLGYFEGLSCTEIATRVGVPVGTVKTRVATALAKLRAVLDGGQGESP